jgi:hypothetical protein
VLKKKEIKDKAKGVLAQNKTTYTKSELMAILKWRLGDNFTEHRNKRISNLQIFSYFLLKLQLKTHLKFFYHLPPRNLQCQISTTQSLDVPEDSSFK